MSKETILKTAMQPKLLNFLDNCDQFDIEDYKLLVQNKVKNAICFIYLIKFKYNLLPDISLLTNKTAKVWTEEIINFIKLDINDLHSILINTMDNNKLAYTDYQLEDIIKKTDGKLTDDSLIKLLANHNYQNSLNTTLNKYDGFITNELFQLIKQFFSRYYDNVKYKFETLNMFKEYIIIKKTITDEYIKSNEHLFDTPDKYAQLFTNFKDVNIELTTKCFNKNKKPPIELIRNIQFNDDPKLFKYYDMYPELYKNANIPTLYDLSIINNLEKDFELFKNRIIKNKIHIITVKRMFMIIVKLYLIKQIYNGQKESVKTFLEDIKNINSSNYIAQIKELYNDMQEYLKEPKKSKKLISDLSK